MLQWKDERDGNERVGRRLSMRRRMDPRGVDEAVGKWKEEGRDKEARLGPIYDRLR